MKHNIVALALILMAVPAFADQCLTSVDGTTSVTSNVTTGTSVQISVTPTGSGGDCDSGGITLQLTYSNCSVTITDPSSPGYYTGVSGGTAKTFTVTSGSSGVCTITARGTTNDGSVDDNTPVILEFIDPSALTISGSPSSASVTENNNFTFSVNITNSQSSDVLVSYALSLPSGITRIAGDPSSASSVTVDAGGIKVYSWVLKHSTCFTGSGTATLQLGDNTNAFSATVSGNSSCSSSSPGSNTSSSSSGGLGGNTTATTNETKLFSTAAGTSLTLAFTQVLSTGVTQIEIKTATAKAGARIVLMPGIKPSGASDPVPAAEGATYSYADITKENILDSDFSSIKIRFRVPVLWINATKIDPARIYMHRYSGGWTRLTTRQLSTDGSYYFYEADSPGFSTFAITGMLRNATNTTTSGPSIAILSPTSSETIVGSTVTVKLSASGITLAEPKGTIVAGEGHFHVWLDAAGEQEGAKTTFVYENVSEGRHNIRVELRNGNHSALNPTVSISSAFTVTYAAANETTAQVTLAAGGDYALIILAFVLIAGMGGGGFFAYKKGYTEKITDSLGSIRSIKFKRKKSAAESNPVSESVDAVADKIRSVREKKKKKKYEYSGSRSYKSYDPDDVREADTGENADDTDQQSYGSS